MAQRNMISGVEYTENRINQLFWFWSLRDTMFYKPGFVWIKDYSFGQFNTSYSLLYHLLGDMMFNLAFLEALSNSELHDMDFFIFLVFIASSLHHAVLY